MAELDEKKQLMKQDKRLTGRVAIVTGKCKALILSRKENPLHWKNGSHSFSLF
jgi:hypothetical protein